MRIPTCHEIVPDSELIAALEAALRANAGTVTRDGNCFLASVNAAHILNHLAVSGFIVVRAEARYLRLDV